MGEVEEKFYRIMFDEETGKIRIELEPWELTSTSVGETYYEKTVEELIKLGFKEARHDKTIILEAEFRESFNTVLNKVKEILEEYETTVTLKKSVC